MHAWHSVHCWVALAGRAVTKVFCRGVMQTISMHKGSLCAMHAATQLPWLG